MRVLRFTVRRLMVAVAIVGLLLGASIHLADRMGWWQDESRGELDAPIICIEDARVTLIPITPDPPRPDRSDAP